ncbi:MAG: SprT family zinc-dependent metalloprotease [Gemmatimonadaceae bacterium]
MNSTIQLGDLVIRLTRKDVKHAHLSVHPPHGRVTLVVPAGTRPEVARAYASSKISWIRNQQAKLQGQARQTRREFTGRESHFLWGRRFLLVVVEKNAKPTVSMDHRKITLTVRPGASRARREEIIHEWHKTLLRKELSPLITKWERKLGVSVSGYFLQRMKTKWGGCNRSAGNIRLNTELVKKPKELLEYVIVHEMIHLLEPTHGERFMAILERNWPTWRESRAELNELPLAPEVWTE